MDWPLTVAVVVLAATAAFIQALSGFGFSLFIVPFLAILIGPKDTVLLANMLSVFSNALQTARLRAHADTRTATILTVGSLVGMPIGLLALLLLDAQTMQIAIAVMVIFFTLLLMRGVQLHAAGLLGDAIAGVTSGILNTSTSMSGPPVVLYLQGKGLSPQTFRATVTVFFLATSSVAVGLLVLTGNRKSYVVGLLLLSIPAMLVGQWAGNHFFERVDHAFFRRMVFAILLVSGAVAIVGALA